MFFTNRFVGGFTSPSSPFRIPAISMGINLILAGVLIAIFPKILVMMISLVLVAAGIAVIIVSLNRTPRRHSWHVE
ncbi:MAG: hypothetical protein CL946_01415 [Ectothiorhodospiraceae bacterium]|nr:hypothetical protein [Ectothiorhodospiraceae bacterium]